MKATEKIAARETKAPEVLTAYAALFETTLKSESKLCLCGMLASEVNSIDPELRAEISDFFKEQHDLLAHIIARGQSKGEIRQQVETEDFAKAYLAALEGAMIMARINNAPSDIMRAADQMISLIQN